MVDVGAGNGVGELTAVGGTDVGVGGTAVGIAVDVAMIVGEARTRVGKGSAVLVGKISMNVGTAVGLAVGITVGTPMIATGGTSGG